MNTPDARALLILMAGLICGIVAGLVMLIRWAVSSLDPFFLLAIPTGATVLWYVAKCARWLIGFRKVGRDSVEPKSKVISASDFILRERERARELATRDKIFARLGPPFQKPAANGHERHAKRNPTVGRDSVEP
jgi:hypothetical protein